MQEFLDLIKENDIKFLRMQFCGIDGISRNMAISDRRVPTALKEGVRFNGDAVEGFSYADGSDLILKPDFSTLTILPWRPQRGKVASVLCEVTYPDGRICEMDSRQVLKKQIENIALDGYTFEVGTKSEFYLFDLDDDGNPTLHPADNGGYASLAPIDKGENIRREIILTLENMGFQIESSHHERGRGQHEIDFRYSEALTAADRVMTLRNTVKNIAIRNGLYATFMPKPRNSEPGSGLNISMMLKKDGKNLFTQTEDGLSETASAFLAGVLEHIPAITAFADPIVNSYKRLATGPLAGRKIAWSYDARDVLIRVPKSQSEARWLELRTPDSTSNPYLVLALLLAAGFDGINRHLTAPTENTGDGALVPLNLYEALIAMKNDPLVEQTLGKAITDKFYDIKTQEWQQYISTVHDWEKAHYFCMY